MVKFLNTAPLPSRIFWGGGAPCKWTWSFENVAKICQFQFLDPLTHRLKIFQGGIKSF